MPLKLHQKIAESALRIRKKIKIVSASDLSEDTLLITAYGLGNPQFANRIRPATATSALRRFESIVQKPIGGIICGEIGAEGLAFQIAAILDLPVIDSDLVGGRAAPEIQLDAFGFYKKAITPVFVAIDEKTFYFWERALSATAIELQARRFVSAHGGSGVLLGYPTSAGEFARISAPGTLTLALEVGKLLLAQNLKKVLELMRGHIEAQVIIEAVNLADSGGFLTGHIRFSKDYVVTVKNELLVLSKDKKIITRVPEYIVLLDENCRPIHNTDVRRFVGKNIYIVTAPARYYWSTPRGRRMWSKFSML